MNKGGKNGGCCKYNNFKYTWYYNVTFSASIFKEHAF